MARARKRFEIVKTEPAEAAIKMLRGAAKAARARTRGCRAAGYRLLDAAGDFSDLCCLHLYSRGASRPWPVRLGRLIEIPVRVR